MGADTHDTHLLEIDGDANTINKTADAIHRISEILWFCHRAAGAIRSRLREMDDLDINTTSDLNVMQIALREAEDLFDTNEDITRLSLAAEAVAS